MEAGGSNLDQIEKMVKELLSKQQAGKGKGKNSGKGKGSKKKLTCRRCQKQGHFAYECKAPAPVPKETTAEQGESQPDKKKQPEN